jgi:hypothetical protein
VASGGNVTVGVVGGVTGAATVVSCGSASDGAASCANAVEAGIVESAKTAARAVMALGERGVATFFMQRTMREEHESLAATAKYAASRTVLCDELMITVAKYDYFAMFENCRQINRCSLART